MSPDESKLFITVLLVITLVLQFLSMRLTKRLIEIKTENLLKSQGYEMTQVEAWYRDAENNVFIQKETHWVKRDTNIDEFIEEDRGVIRLGITYYKDASVVLVFNPRPNP